jgi:hypothetical protein
VPTKFAEIFTVLGNNFPTYDQVLILVNTPHYGGSGGTFATTSLNSRSSDIAIHELGHSFARLKDEYYAGDNFASESFNMTQETDPENVKWKNWMGTNGVGIYQHCCSGNSSEWYRPHQSCMMRSLSANFCPVCTERTIETIHGLVEFIDNYSPGNMDPLSSASPLTFNIETVEPNPNTLEIEWVLNGDTINNAESSLSIEQSDLNPGDNQLQVTVRDSTTLLRIDNHDFFHYSTVIWEINNSTVSTSRISSNTLKMRLFPNPNQDVLYFDFAKTIEEDYTVMIRDVSGNQMMVKNIDHLDQNPKILLGQLPSGVYIVNFIFNDGIIISRKIIKQ